MEAGHEEHFRVRDRFGKLYRCWMEICSDCQCDWDEVIELCAHCFYDAHTYKEDCPEDGMRLQYLRKLFQWEFSSSGMTGEGDGELICVKARLLEDDFSSTSDGYKIILAATMTEGWLKNKQKLPDLPKKQLKSILETLSWEKKNIFNVLEEVASELGTRLWYFPYGFVHPHFQGTGIGKDVLGKAVKRLANHVLKNDESKSMGMTIRICNNPIAVNVAESFGDIKIAHLHFKNPADGSFYCYKIDKVDGADCYWILVTEPTNSIIVNTLKKKFGFKYSKL